MNASRVRQCERCRNRKDDVEMTECGYPCGPHRWCNNCRRINRLTAMGATPAEAQQFVDEEFKDA